MRKALLLLALLALPACATIQRVSDDITLATTGINNPVTPDMLNTVENGAIIVFAGLGAYRRSCIAKTIPQSCRQAIKSVQVYTRKLPALLISLRKFVRTNDQVNAAIAFRTVQQMIVDFRATAISNGIQVQ